MQSINLPSTPLSPKLFNFHLTAAVRRFGEENGVHILDDGNKFCPACFVQIAETPLWLIHRQPIWCEFCGRILVNSRAERLALLATLSSALAGAPSPAPSPEFRSVEVKQDADLVRH